MTSDDPMPLVSPLISATASKPAPAAVLEPTEKDGSTLVGELAPPVRVPPPSVTSATSHKPPAPPGAIVCKYDYLIKKFLKRGTIIARFI